MSDCGIIFERFVEIVRKLRAENGCPWDRAQTPQSLQPYLQEETGELLEAIANNDHQHVKEELGDILYLIILLARIYAEEDKFAIDDVIAAVNDKMVRRHPHVFSDAKTGSAAELRQQWLEIKAREKAGRDGPEKN